jgi:hypothetical protein
MEDVGRIHRAVAASAIRTRVRGPGRRVLRLAISGLLAGLCLPTIARANAVGPGMGPEALMFSGPIIVVLVVVCAYLALRGLAHLSYPAKSPDGEANGATPEEGPDS